MNILHAVLREDFGQLDASAVRAGLLTEQGIADVRYGETRNRLRIEYDPRIVTRTKLVDIMCRHALFPAPGRRDD